LAARWFADNGHTADAVRHLQAAGDWYEASQLLADHLFSMTLDGRAETVRALLRAFPLGFCSAHVELAVVHAADDIGKGRLDDATARLALARSHLGAIPALRQPRLRITIASLDLLLARQRGNFAHVIEQVNLLATPIVGRSNADLTLSRDLRAHALLNLGTAEAWSLRLHDSERHLDEGAALARDIDRPYLEVACLAQLGFATKVNSFTLARRHCEQAIALAGRHGWDAEPVVVPALATLAGLLIWTGEFDDAQQWLRRAEHAAAAGVDPAIRLLLHLKAGMLHAGRGRHCQALAEFDAAKGVQAIMAGEHAITPLVTSWTMATQARLGRVEEARALLASLTETQAARGEIRNAAAVIRLAEGDPSGARRELRPLLDGTSALIHDAALVETHLLDAVAARKLGDARAANAAVERALGVAEPDRLILPFVIIGARESLETVPRSETAHAALLADILDALGGPCPTTTDDLASQAGGLSRSELRVLRYLPTNLTRPEIAGQLSVSLNTVNTHVRNIYAKLGARDRTSAVARARELRLVSAGRDNQLAVT
jgi:LuxR family maltose regulon positive regulatory protein